MKNTYDFVSATCAPVPFIAVVWGEDGFEPGSTLFQVEIGDQLHAVELGVQRLVHVANQQGQALLDHLVGEEVTVFDLPSITAAVEASQKPMVLPEAFNDEAVERVISHMSDNWQPKGLVDSASLLAIDALVRGAQDLEVSPDSSGDGFEQLVRLANGVIERLEQFKSLCKVKPKVFSFSEYQGFIDQRRSCIANQAFESYDFNMECVDQDSGWRVESSHPYGGQRYMKIARFQRDSDEVRVVMHVVFAPNSLAIEEAFALDLDTGAMI